MKNIDTRFGNRKNDRQKSRNIDREIETNPNSVAGRNSVRELLKTERDIDKIFVQKGEKTGSITSLIAEAKSRLIPVVEVDKIKLDKMCGGLNHQGIIAVAAEKEYSSIDEILEYAYEKNEKPLIVIADKIEDPHNLGAIIRSAECAGAHGIIIPKRNGALLTQTVSKSSAGALEHLRVAKVSNLAYAIEELKEKGLWIFASEAGGQNYYSSDLTLPAAIIMGSEGNGVSKLLLDKSDFRISIPMYGNINSFNVSAAAAVILCEAARQRNS